MVKLKEDITNETRRERFKRIAEKRTNNAIKFIRLIGNLSEKTAYEYNKNDISKITQVITFELKKTEDRFNATAIQKPKMFTLDDDLDANGKTCIKCGEYKPYSDYWRDRKRPDGHENTCKQCRVK